MFERIFGDQTIAGGPDDLLALLDQAEPETLPSLYLSCGTEDPLYADNVAFDQACRRAGVDVTTHFVPGEHEWGFWDARIQEVLAWLPLRSTASTS
jgi:S-formylglutathione hydrolase FrmB